MNYYKALEKKDESGEPSGIYHFTITNDDRTMAIGYCSEKNCTHKTAEEASDCYKRWCIEKNHSTLPGGFKLEENQEWGTQLIFFSSY